MRVMDNWLIVMARLSTCGLYDIGFLWQASDKLAIKRLAASKYIAIVLRRLAPLLVSASIFSI